MNALTRLGFDHPTPVQRQAIPPALAHKDLKIIAETGSGKTAAFLLPTLHRLLECPSGKVMTRALILAPTRELARQIYQQCRQLTEFSDLQTRLVTGGEDFKSQQKNLRTNPDILISTPGRLLEHLELNPTVLSSLEILIVDEADRMLDMGFTENVLAIVERCNKQRQTLILSATLTHNGINKIADKLLNSAEVIALTERYAPPIHIRQEILPADDNVHKQKLLAHLLLNTSYEKAIVFANTRLNADQLKGPLLGKKLRVGVLHGEMEQKERNRIMALFQSGAVSILITTDLAARGLDIKGIGLVINFDVPRNGVDYLHRIGRTGRGDESGRAVTLVKATEWNLMSAIGRFLKLDLEYRTIEGLEGSYHGPKKMKKSGKAAGGKKKATAVKAVPEKIKKRHRDRKNIGKRRKPASAAT
ncbi:MAG: DEAD/DEAH box helicase [Gammaproteobacteria bacterium]